VNQRLHKYELKATFCLIGDKDCYLKEISATIRKYFRHNTYFTACVAIATGNVIVNGKRTAQVCGKHKAR